MAGDEPEEVDAPPADATAPAESKPRVRRVAWLLFGFLLAVYLLTGKGFSDILDAEGYYLIAKAMVDDGTVGVRPELSSAVLRGDEPRRGDRAFLHFGVGYPLFIAPAYLVGKVVGEAAARVSPRLARFERFVPRAAVSADLALVTALTAIALFHLLLLLGMSLRAAAAGSLLFGLATYAWPYAKIGYYEPFIGLCQMAALLWALVYARTQQARWVLLAGFACGWGFAAKPTMGLLLPVLIPYVAWAAWRGEKGGRLARLATAACALVGGLAVWGLVILRYNAARTGTVTDLGYSTGDYQPWLYAQHITEALIGNTVSPGRGFFVFSPMAVLFVLGIGWFWRQARAELAAILALFALNFGYFATRGNWATMRPWGPRYVETLAPLFVALAVPGIVALWPRPRARKVMCAVIALSVCVQLLAIAVPFGAWLDRVKAETGSGFSAVFHAEYSPLWGQLVLLREAKLTPINAPASEIASGEPSEAFKRELRASPDFWFAYAWRLGAPHAPIAAAALILLGVCGWLGRGLWRELGAAGRQRDAS